MENNKKAILITGVAGLLGSRMADWILKNKTDFEVIGIDDLSGGYVENIPKDVIFYKLDLADDDIKFIFHNHNIKIIYHFAAYAAEGLSPFIRKYNYQNNLRATVSLINEAIIHEIDRFVFTSSMAVYGHGENSRFSESLTPNPIDPYGIAKFACEMDLKIAGVQHGLEWCIIRPHNVYGINQNIWDKYRNVLGIWIYQTINDQALTIYGDGEQMRAFSYIDDILMPLWLAATSEKAKNQIINLGGIHEYTINEACDILTKITGYNNKSYLEQRHEVKVAVPTFQKSIDLLNFEHKIELNEGLKNMWEWSIKQPNRERFKWDKYEVEKGIYNYWK